MKKTLKLLTVMILVIAAGSLVMLGCANPADGSNGAPGQPGDPGGTGTPGGPGVATLPEDAEPALLKAYYDAGINEVFVVADLGEGTFTVPEGKTLGVVGAVTLTNATIINAFEGTLDVRAGSTIGGDIAVFIVSNADDYTGKITSGSIPAYVPVISDTVPAANFTGDVVVPALGIGLAGAPSATRLDILSNGNTVYVTGDVTINAADTTEIDSKLVVFGETRASGAGGITLSDDVVVGTLKATGALKITEVGTGGIETLDLNGQTVTIADDTNIAEITSTASGAVIALDAETDIVPVTVGASDIEVTTSGNALTVAKLSTGTGKLIVPASAVTFTATAGGGNFAYKTAPAGVVTLSSTTGLTYVGGALALTNTLGITGDVEFNGNLTGVTVITAAADLTVNGALTLGSGGKISVGGDLEVTGNLTLSAETTNALAVTGEADIGTLTTGNGANEISFADGTIGTLTLGGNGTKLTVTGTVIIEQPVTSIGASKTLTLKGAGLVGFPGSTSYFADLTTTNIGISGGSGAGVTLNGTAITAIPAGATLYVGGGADTIGTLTVGGTKTLNIADTGSVVVLPGSTLSVPVDGKIATGADVTKAKLTVKDPSAASKISVSGAPSYLVTAIDSGSTGYAGDIVLGTVKYTILNAAVEEIAGADAAGGTAAGSITAGEDTTIVLVGTS